MRYLIQLQIIFLIMATVMAEAQTDVSIRRKDFKMEKPGFNQAWKHVKDGDSYYTEGGIWYGNAFDEYIKAIAYNNTNPELNYKTGVAALFSDNREEAAGFLLKAGELNKDVTEDIMILTARALHFSGRYSEAIGKFNDYLTSPGKKQKKDIALATRSIEECNSALKITRDTLRVSVENPGANINSSADDYSEVLSADGKTMYFASRRETPGSGKRKSDTKFDENIFVSKRNRNSWDPSLAAGKNITTDYCETPLYLSKFGDKLYIYSGSRNGGDITVSQIKKGEWKAPVAVDFPINTKGSETSFTISPSGNEIYFVSDNRKGGLGGKDIFFIKKMSEKKWSKPQNAGSLINTTFDEESVRFSATGDTLWFSSRGHNSIGGFDIFFSVKNKIGEWDTVKNIGYPVNTPWDELFYTSVPNEDSTFYFVSNRSGGLGGLDIYYGRILPPKKIPVIIPTVQPKPDTIVIRDTVVVIKEAAPPPPPPVIEQPKVNEVVLFLIGKITDSDTGDPVMAKVDVVDLATNAVVVTTASSDVDGSYRVRLPAKKSYMVDLRATGFLSDMKRIDIPANWPGDVYNLNVDLIKVKVGKKVVLNNILFETGKAVLTAGSYTELERLLNIMNDDTKIKIEISGHTDKTGSEPLNFKLSEARAKSVVDYLVKKGIDPSRLQYKGFGSLQPISENATPQGRAKNRRVEFKILEF